VPLSPVKFHSLYRACCGNTICKACYYENEESVNKQNEEKSAGKKVAFACPFCREPDPTPDMELARLQARCLLNDHKALAVMGDIYRDGACDTVKDDLKALDCYIRAAELGSPEACLTIGNNYYDGNGVAVNKKKAALFHRAGALRGSIVARNNVGTSEYNDLGNHEIGIRHWKIAANAGYQKSLDVLRRIYNKKAPGKEFISNEYLEATYRACHEVQMEVATEERVKHGAHTI
jgi:TPR repeat protein